MLTQPDKRTSQPRSDGYRTVWACLRCGKDTVGDEGDHECQPMPEQPPLPVLVAWCNEDKWYLAAEHAGENCPGEDCGHKLRKRRGWLCGHECEHDFFFERSDAVDHIREYAADA